MVEKSFTQNVSDFKEEAKDQISTRAEAASRGVDQPLTKDKDVLKGQNLVDRAAERVGEAWESTKNAFSSVTGIGQSSEQK